MMSSRNLHLHDPLARSASEAAARRDGLRRPLDLAGFGGFRGQEQVQAGGHVGEDEGGAAKSDDGGDAHADDPADRHAGHPKGRAEGGGDQGGLADIGFQQEKDHGDEIEAKGNGDAGDLTLLRLGEHPGHQDQQGRFHELGRLQSEAGEFDPAGGALGVMAQERQGHHGDDGHEIDEERHAPHAAWPQDGRAENDHHAQGGEGALAKGEMERRGDAEARRRGRTGAELKQNAQDDQRARGAEQPAIGRPPPLRPSRCIRPGERVRAGDGHAGSPTSGSDARAWTAARKASPRASKSVN